MLNLRAKVTNHGFQASETAQELGLLLCRGVAIVWVATAAGNTTRDGKDAFGLVFGARTARMASIAAHFAPSAVYAAPHLQAFYPVGVISTVRLWRMQRHLCGRQPISFLGRFQDLGGIDVWMPSLSDSGLRPWIRSSPLLAIFFLLALLIGQLAELSSDYLKLASKAPRSQRQRETWYVFIISNAAPKKLFGLPSNLSSLR